MAYQIQYGQDGVQKTTKRDYRIPKIGRKGAVQLCVLIGVIVLVSACLLPQFRLWIRNAFIPGDPDVTAAAATRLIESISEGESVQAALTEFCREILDYGLQTA